MILPQFKVVIITGVLFLTQALNGYCQLSIDAGTDTTFCINNSISDTLWLNQIKINNGKSPYTTAWSTTFIRNTKKPFYASDFLNDTTSIKPFFNDHLISSDWLTFFIYVTDANGNTALDSVKIRFSNFTFTLGYTVEEISSGDSVQIFHSGIGGGIPPLEYYWKNTEWLSYYDDTYWSKPDSSFKYSDYVEDSIGCISPYNLACEIRVLPTSFQSIKNENELNLKLINDFLTFNNLLSEEVEMKQFTVSGQLILHTKTNNNKIQLYKNSKLSNYIIQIKKRGKIRLFKTIL